MRLGLSQILGKLCISSRRVLAACDPHRPHCAPGRGWGCGARRSPPCSSPYQGTVGRRHLSREGQGVHSEFHLLCLLGKNEPTLFAELS